MENKSDKESDDEDSHYNVQETISDYKCEMCEFDCQNEVTLNKNRNAKHCPISGLGPRNFGQGGISPLTSETISA